MSVQNRPALPVNCYTQRAAAKKGACFICSTFTSSLLMTEHESPRDWFYVCETHVQSRSFCTAIEGANKGASQEPAAQEPSKEPQSGGEDKSSPNSTDDKTKDTDSKSQEAKSTDNAESKSTASPTPVEKPRYALSSHYFYLRQRPFIKRWEQQQAELLAQRLPRAPQHRPQ